MRWSVVTVTYNSAEKLKEAWASFSPSDYAEWIVVDNCSHDGSADVAEALGASRVIRLPENRGFGAANNVGVRHSGGDLLFFANPDLFLTQSVLEDLEQQVGEGGKIVAPQLASSNGELQPNGRGNPTLVGKIVNRVFPGRFGDYYRYAAPGHVMQVRFAIGAALSLSKSDFNRIGGWDEAFFVYYEDSDLCLRADKLGIPTVVDGNVKCCHLWARETANISLGAWKNELRSGWTFYRRYPRLIV